MSSHVWKYMKNKMILHDKNISLYLFSTFLNECKTKLIVKQSYFLIMFNT